ncbi:hypothetical protein PTNB73_08449 [Pyrenophora teres f. teres]|nr:hypothetical protein HRS9139_08559 [Pyrenophora teres f. teres]KAE8834545.1 hypothetical protein PTNB85_05878 [Pyrenophora teres f. teres]KAE8858969.1 hypothetical protein PTNB73_08449 [Pyrenophora teres f. teres]KAE8860832.1 hypothetical protein PTNB29_05927 [Pyrenophora teres f. teres]
MSAAAGAPPPPPPPPGPPDPPDDSNPFEKLPAELLLMIYEYAGSRSLPNLALAIYPTLQRHNLAPVLTIDTFIRITLGGLELNAEQEHK